MFSFICALTNGWSNYHRAHHDVNVNMKKICDKRSHWKRKFKQSYLHFLILLQCCLFVWWNNTFSPFVYNSIDPGRYIWCFYAFILSKLLVKHYILAIFETPRNSYDRHSNAISQIAISIAVMTTFYITYIQKSIMHAWHYLHAWTIHPNMQQIFIGRGKSVATKLLLLNSAKLICKITIVI